MKEITTSALLLALVMLTAPVPAADRGTVAPRAVADAINPSLPGTVQLQGWLGGKIDLCLKRRIWTVDPEKLIRPFRENKDNGSWSGEFWGKWYTAAVLADACRPSLERRSQLENIAGKMIRAQKPDGYLGTYDVDHRLSVWDVWCRKYVLLGLLAAYDLTGDKRVLEAARRNVDNMIDELEQKKLTVVDVGKPVLQGVADSSILEPIASLYQRTGERRYLAFAESILAQWNAPSKSAPQGIHLLDKALAGVPPMQNHAYCIMSCFEGICELYRAAGDRQYLEAAVRFGQAVRQYERMIDGSVGNHEDFCGGARYQTEFLEAPQETCATATWMKLCVQLLRLTGDPLWADELELSLYNAMIGAMTPGGEWFAYFTPLTGERVPSPESNRDIHLSCCVASAPRALLLTPRWAVMSAREGPVVNLYAPGIATIKLADGTAVSIVQETDYPVGDQVGLTISPARKHRFTLRLRIPTWSKRTTLVVNGEPVACEPGKYAKLDRDWAPGDRVALALDLRGHAVQAPSGAPQLAILRGPVLLALDNRLMKVDDTTAWLAANAEGFVELKPSASRPPWAWMTFDVPFEAKARLVNHPLSIAMYDFASAGNAWSEKNVYRVWLPQPLWLRQAFPAETWRRMNYGPNRHPIPDAVRVKDATGKRD